MIDDPIKDQPGSSEKRSRLNETMADAFGFMVLAVSVACPWVMWSAWGPWAGVVGVAAGQVLYMALLKPPGICLGLAWVFTALSGVVALVSICVTLLARVVN